MRWDWCRKRFSVVLGNERWIGHHAITLLLLFYGSLNALVYSSLLPLWEGFDEPFHYGYVETLCFKHRLPIEGQTRLNAEIWKSLHLVPVSHVVRQNIPGLMVFSEYFKLPGRVRSELRARLLALPRQPTEPSPQGNYEAQQPPLAYAILALPNRIWSDVPLPGRIWRLRLVCGIAASLMTALLTLALSAKAGAPSHFGQAAAFLVLSSQPFYAATAHVCNDWLSIPLVSLFFYAAISVYDRPSARSLTGLVASLCLGLLTKAYFLSLTPLALGLLIVLVYQKRLRWRAAMLSCIGIIAVAAPWYVRNLYLYGRLSGVQDPTASASATRLWRAVFEVPWVPALLNTARYSLWDGNNSAVSFSRTTIDIMLALLVVASILWITNHLRRPAAVSERLLAIGIALFGAGLLYSVIFLFVITRGAGIGTASWYVAAVIPGVFSLLASGMAGYGRTGRLVLRLMLCLWTYVLFASYIAKLIPLYAGYGEGRANLYPLVQWYGRESAAINERLSTICVTSPAVIYATLPFALGVSVALFAFLVSGADRRPLPAEVDRGAV